MIDFHQHLKDEVLRRQEEFIELGKQLKADSSVLPLTLKADEEIQKAKEHLVKYENELIHLRNQREIKQRLIEEEQISRDWPLKLDLIREEEPFDWLVEGVIPRGENALLIAPNKVGKTSIVVNLVKSLIDGAPFLGKFPVAWPTAKVAVLDFEMSETMLRNWYGRAKIEGKHFEVLPMMGHAQAFNLLSANGLARAVERLRGTSVLIIDCLGPLLTAIGQSELHVGPFLAALGDLKRHTEIEEIVLVHHMALSADRERGDSRLGGWPAAILRITTPRRPLVTPDTPRSFSAFGRNIFVPKSRLTLLEDGISLEAGKEIEPEPPRGPKRQNLERERILGLLSKEKISSANKAFERIGGNRNRVLATWKELLAEGVIVGDSNSGFGVPQ